MLREDMRRLLGIALRLVGKAVRIRVHLDAAFGDGRPGDQDAVRLRNRAVSLIAGEMTAGRGERLAPQRSASP